MTSAHRVSSSVADASKVVENLHLARQPFPNFEAIYILTPTAESIQSSA